MGSPFRSTRHDAYKLSSSPSLPSLDQIQSQFPKQPPIRCPMAATSTPTHASHHFTNPSSFLRQEQPPIDLTTPCRDEPVPPRPQEEEEVTVISIANVPRPKRKRGVKVLEKKALQPPSPSKPIKDASASPPWKRYANPKKPAAKSEKKPKAAKLKAAAKKSGVQSHHFAKPKDEGEEDSPPLPTSPKKDANEPLELEAALRRRVDWTPPPADNGMASASKSSQAIDLLSSTVKSPGRAASKETFENLFETFGRPDEELKRPSAEPFNGDRPVLKKRKLIETMPVNESSKMGPPQKGPLKAKAPRKKPRTITELATAAYAVPDATEQEQPSAPPVESIEDGGETAKSKGKKRASKANKPKKAPPPEPILLSPTAALRQAANQDYVFGTSSQLAREHSPTFLRDLQSALQASNSMREDPFVTPVNSDAIEPEPKQKLWDVGARDEDGRLLDLEVINLADTPQAAPDAADGLNPFGYAGIDQRVTAPPAHMPSDVSFPDIEDLLNKDVAIDLPPHPVVSTQEKVNALLPAHMLSDMSFPDIDDLLGKETDRDDKPRTQNEALPSSPPHRPANITAQSVEVLLVSSGPGANTEEEASNLRPFESPPAQESEACKSVVAEAAAPQIAKPDFGLYTDNQLAREISSYGFKPVKRRQAMLALLDQCWVGKQRTALSSLPTNRPISTTTSQAQAAAKSQKPAATASPKRPRGRPRKTSVVEVGAEVEMPSSEPPPSAQPPPPSPKRGRGRPRKNTEATTVTDSTASKKGKSKATSSASKEPKAPRKAASPVASPPKKKAKVRKVIEIPDSESEGALSLSPSPCSSPEPTFSPAPDEASVSIGDDTEMSLAASQSQRSEVLFARITEAVTSAPPTTDPKQPSFHEMMLMYDPIVLEDLASWLNTGQLSRVGYDGEVSPTEVKQWCESKSVCCLWRESLRGKERKRY
ncbi:AT hook domain-containing protein [Colletotrichum godetiae]|uniref:Structure-specific endonuclease subunit SLX4 n=1 Tax=Colletotrichum godetiae TaxID=1209918 RepID=A0AAJ0EQ77_9PEZI|nr:AT hook domain-containing protein [Colletotrichum godetiae]KAK1657319.1 AT hook domain-containing protein [Colletotrichum godetiae]